MVLAQLPGHADDQLHGVVRTLNDPAAEEQSFYVVSFVKIECQRDDFLGREAGPLHIAGPPVDAIVAIVQTNVGHQYFQQRDAPSVRGVRMTDAGAPGRADPFASARVFARRSTAGARSVVFRGVSEDFEFTVNIHAQGRERVGRPLVCAVVARSLASLRPSGRAGP